MEKDPVLFETSVLYDANLNSTADIVVDQGGTSSGKTYSILQVLFTLAVRSRVTITVVGQDYPNLRVGPIRQAEEIVDNSPLLKTFIKPAVGSKKLFNEGSKSYVFFNGSRIEFKSYLTAQGAKSGKRHYLFVNEINGINKEIFFELNIRTSIRTWVDYNPNSEFYIHEEYIGQPGVELIISDHRHNPFIVDKTREKIEALKSSDLELWKVYARGMTGKITGMIFNNYFMCDAIPEGAKLIAHALDFGYTNDPTFYGSVYMYQGEIYLDERLYETGLTNPDIAKRIKGLDYKYPEEIVADQSEQKSIKELCNMGLFVSEAIKGPDSVINGIDILKRYRINITRRSVNLKKEFQNYLWKTDVMGKPLNVPIDAYNHGIDAVRYVALKFLKKRNPIPPRTYLPGKKVDKPTVRRGMYADLLKNSLPKSN